MCSTAASVSAGGSGEGARRGRERQERGKWSCIRTALTDPTLTSSLTPPHTPFTGTTALPHHELQPLRDARAGQGARGPQVRRQRRRADAAAALHRRVLPLRLVRLLGRRGGDDRHEREQCGGAPRDQQGAARYTDRRQGLCAVVLWRCARFEPCAVCLLYANTRTGTYSPSVSLPLFH